MRTILLACCFTLHAFHAHAQNVAFEDGFEDGNFSINPTWSGDEQEYTVIEGPPGFLLQLQGDSDNGGVSYLSTPSSRIEGYWAFFLQLDFAPSNGNRADIFLMSDIPDLEGTMNGYALRAGENGSGDVFRLVRYDDGREATTILSGTTDISSGGAFRLRVQRQAGGQWALEVGTGYDGLLYPEGGIQTDSTYSEASYFGVRSTYTRTRATQFRYDFKIDLPPLFLSSAKGRGNQVTLSFSQPYDPATVQPSDFSVDKGIGSPASLSFPSSTTLLLTFADILPSDHYTIAVQEILSQSGQSLEPDASANFIVAAAYGFGDVHINEFMYDPPVGQAEYVELKNRSSSYLDLRDWHIADESASRIITSQSYFLAPNSYVVITPDSTALFNTYGSRPYLQLSGMPNLNNSGDVIRVWTPDGTLVDSLRYAPDWGGNDVALERRRDTTSSLYPENFGDSPATLGGTPGAANEVADDTTPPTLTDLQITNSQTLDLRFSERLQSGNASMVTNYAISGEIGVDEVQQIAAEHIRLNLGAPLQNASAYQLTISRQEDLFGNTSAAIDTSFTYYEISAADSGDVFITEFMYTPPDGSTEYIELFNTSSKSLNLENWTINDNTGNRRIITPNSYILPPGRFVVLAPDETLLGRNPDISLIPMGTRFPSLNNSGDDIVLRTARGQLLDSLRYTRSWNGNEVALERRSMTVAPIQPNFGEAPNGFGTPGSRNEIAPDNQPPVLQNVQVRDAQTLEITFSEPITQASALNASNYTLDPSIRIQQIRSQGAVITIRFEESFVSQQVYAIRIEGVEDLFSNTLQPDERAFKYVAITGAETGDIFINEFMYNPPEGYTEYIELHNTSDKTLDLARWTINDNTGNRRRISDSRLVVEPKGYIVLAPDAMLRDSLPGIHVATLGSRFPTLNNSGDDIVVRDSTGTRLDSLRYTNRWGGNGIAMERRTLSVAPIRANFGNAPNGFGTPGSANQIEQDTTPPTLWASEIKDSQSLLFIFSEMLDVASATDPTHYALSGGISIQRVALAGGDTVRVVLSAPMQNDTEYTATVRDVQDIFGNTLNRQQRTFSYYELSEAASGDLVINEFMSHPPDGSTEYIELFNASTKSFDLQGYTINDNTGNRRIITRNSYILPPAGYVVMAPDETVLQANPTMKLLPMGTRFPSLNNSGDDIVLRTAAGQLLDSLRYTRAWGGNEVALERRSPAVAPIRANFGEAPNGFGTPGSINDIAPDREAPELQRVQVLDASTLQLVFSEAVDPGTTTDRASYTLAPERDIQFISTMQDTVTLYLAAGLESQQPYQLTVRGIQDLFGNTLPATTREVVYVSFARAAPGDVVINEILYTRAEARAPEFVELYNRTGQNFDLSGWILGDARSSITLRPGTHLLAGNYLVLTDAPSLAQAVAHGFAYSNFPSLNDDEDAVYIQNKSGERIDSLFYSPAFGGNVRGKSAERKDPGAASNDPANFATSTAPNGATPGQQNAVFQRDDRSPTMTFSQARSDGTIEVRFNEFIARTDDLRFLADDVPLTITFYDPWQANHLVLTPPVADGPRDAQADGRNAAPPSVITAENMQDLSGNLTLSVQQPIAYPLTRGDVVINEIMFNPLDDAHDNRPDQREYIELRNIRDYAIVLEGINLHDAPDENGAIRAVPLLTTHAKRIPAQGTALIYAEDNAPSFSESTLARFFDLQNPDTDGSSVIRVDRTSLSLASSGDAIYMRGPAGGAVDSVFYDESWHNPNIVDTKGIALERINPFGESNDASNWGSSTDELGGTPHRENTLFQVPNRGNSEEVGIWFNPNPFSPDDDGDEDHLFINYTLDHPDYLLTVHIYDRYGRRVRVLADSKPAGLEGTLTWNGRKDDGTPNRIGIYIVIFKAFDSSTGSSKTFKKTVVLARRLN